MNTPDERSNLTSAAAAVSRQSPLTSDTGLAGGLAGLALVNLVVGEAFSDTACLERAASILQRCFRLVVASPNGLGLFNGLSGIAWSLTHGSRVLRSKALHKVASKIVNAVQEGLSEQRVPHVGNDLISGLTGIGLAALSYGDDCGDYTLLANVCDLLCKRCTRNHHGAYWYTDASQLPAISSRRYPDECQDYGVAHGHVGVLALFTRASSRLESASVQNIARESVDWLVASQLPSGAHSVLPAIEAGAKVEFVEHFGWCYGDLGAAAVLRTSVDGSMLLSSEELIRTLVVRSTQRYASRSESPACRSLCHGYSGTSVLWKQLANSAVVDAEIGRVEREFVLERVRQLANISLLDEAATESAADRNTQVDGGLLMGDAGVILTSLLLQNAMATDWWLEPFALSRRGADAR